MLFQKAGFVQIFRLFLCYIEWQLQKRWGVNGRYRYR
jgi:hypothetical protein